VLDTRAPRRLVEGAYAERRSACQAAARALGVAALRDATPAQVEAAAERLGEPNHRRARHVVTENARVLEATALLRRRALVELGPLLNASHASLRDDYEVSSPELDTAVEAALAAGAVGARMTEAGFGGCALALVPADRLQAAADGVRETFSARSFDDPATLAVATVDGARRLA
jgi:galactokinase